MSPAHVVLRGVQVAYGERIALGAVDLRVTAGERVALVGPSGAGKSTLLALCTGSVSPTEGQIEILGVDLDRATPRALQQVRSRIGSVYQQFHLVGPLRVIHNVNAGRLGSWSRRRAVWSLLRSVDLDRATNALAKVGIADRVFERTDRLSGGEQQRVALARVLVQEPDLILADEPVSSLDPARAEAVMDLLCDGLLEGGRTLVVSLHDFDLARRRCDRVIGLRGGRIVFDLPAHAVTDAMGTELYLVDTP